MVNICLACRTDSDPPHNSCKQQTSFRKEFCQDSKGHLCKLDSKRHAEWQTEMFSFLNIFIFWDSSTQAYFDHIHSLTHTSSLTLLRSILKPSAPSQLHVFFLNSLSPNCAACVLLYVEPSTRTCSPPGAPHYENWLTLSMTAQLGFVWEGHPLKSSGWDKNLSTLTQGSTFNLKLCLSTLISIMHSFVDEEDKDSLQELTAEQKCFVEHILCTKPLPCR